MLILNADGGCFPNPGQGSYGFVAKRDGRYLVTGSQDAAERTFEAEQLLVATGRRPNTAGMGLEEAGVRLGERGEILADDRVALALLGVGSSEEAGR